MRRYGSTKAIDQKGMTQAFWLGVLLTIVVLALSAH